MSLKADVVVCGAGIAGVATAYHLSVKRGVRKVVLVDPRPPLTLTSDKSTECYRNWWPNAPMVGLMNRSIDLLEEMARESDNAFHLSRQGYLYVTASSDRLRDMEDEGISISNLGAGELRRHPGVSEYQSPSVPGRPEGADLFLEGDELRRFYPFLTEQAVGGIHARRAGWFSAQQLGAWMIERALQHGLEIVKASVSRVFLQAGTVGRVLLDSGQEIATPIFVNAAGPMLAQVGRLLEVELPVFSEVHIKVAFRDHLRVIPRHSPMVIWSDPQSLSWSEAEVEALQSESRTDLLGAMPAACHYRPEGGPESDWLVALWEYHRLIQEPTWPLPDDPVYPEAVMRGLTTMVPGLAVYLDRLPQPVVDGGYYTKTRENRPLVGPLGVDGAFVVGAFSGFGVMAAAAAGELAAMYVTNADLPVYATAFALSRYKDPGYLAEIDTITNTGQI
ncbi:MAG TPA: FAD-dependent oxidoreductase [Acidimicrobiia bacterium]|nr:FAD-dependent oxidoreductase [Acidimicrobiia bacterium]